MSVDFFSFHFHSAIKFIWWIFYFSDSVFLFLKFPYGSPSYQLDFFFLLVFVAFHSFPYLLEHFCYHIFIKSLIVPKSIIDCVFLWELTLSWFFEGLVILDYILDILNVTLWVILWKLCKSSQECCCFLQHKWTCLWNRLTDIENRLVVAKVGGRLGWGRIGRLG